MNKKGFILVETIMVVVILITTLTLIYSSFSKLISYEKRRVMFDDTSYIYRTYYLEDFLVSLNMEQYIKKYLVEENNKIIEFTCSDISLYNAVDQEGNINQEELNKRTFCEQLINTGNMNVKKIYITKYNVMDLKKCTTSTGKLSCSDASINAMKTMSINTLLYIRTLTGTGDGYRIIIEYEENIVNPSDKYIPKNNSCKPRYTLINNQCQKMITKNYYNNVKMITRGV